MIHSVRNAWQGIVSAVKREKNFQIELFVAVVVLFTALAMSLSPAERAILFLAVGGVLSFELLNTSFERVIDMLKPGIHPYAKIAKDISAGAVLLFSIFAASVGIIIFLPRIIAAVNGY